MRCSLTQSQNQILVVWACAVLQYVCVLVSNTTRVGMRVSQDTSGCNVADAIVAGAQRRHRHQHEGFVSSRRQ